MQHEFCDECPGCRPGLLDIHTGKPLPQDKEPMISILRMWRGQTSYAQRKAYVNVMVNNSRDESDIKLTMEVVNKIQVILKRNSTSRPH